MPWHEVGKLESRRLFITAIESGELSFSAACRHFGITRPCGYKWKRRFDQCGLLGLMDQSRRPHSSASSTASEVVEAVIAERKQRPAWGARKIRKRLEMQGIRPPSERTVNRILKGAGLVETAKKEKACQRFARSRCNALWQMDHKSAFRIKWKERVVPFGVIDDASRYCLGLWPLTNKGYEATWSNLWGLFGHMGLPEAILSDNAPLFAGVHGPSTFEANLMRLGIDVLHGRTYHPQTQGKIERFFGTVQRELLNNSFFSLHSQLQPAFDGFRNDYNFERPHESLEMKTPGSCYQPSSRRRPSRLPAVNYSSGLMLRKVMDPGYISYKSHRVQVGGGLIGHWVEVRELEGGIEVLFGPYPIMRDDLQGYTKWKRHYRKWAK